MPKNIIIHVLFQAHQLSGFSSKVEVIPETTLIAGNVTLTPDAANEAENSGIFSALRGANPMAAWLFFVFSGKILYTM